MQVTVSVTVELAASSGVNEVEASVSEAGRKAMSKAMGEACREYEREVIAKGCPGCSGGVELLSSKGTRRRIVVAAFGRTELQLRRMRCERCGCRLRPAAGFLEDLGGANITRRLREECAETGVSAPSYEAAARWIERACGARVDAETVRSCTNRAGSEEAQRQAQRAEAVHSPTAESVRAKAQEPKRTPPEVLQVGLDGGWVASRDQPKGMEGKLAVVATQVEGVGNEGRSKLTQRLLTGTLGSSKDLGVLACAACIELGGHEAVMQSVHGDGANWIKSEAGRHFGAAVKILDWAHLWRAVARAVRSARPGKERKQERNELYQSLRELLWRGESAGAVEVLEGLRGTEEATALEAAIKYIHNQRDWIGDYERWREQGYPIGSGLVERQVELVINRRLKRRGMRWLRNNADSVLALRLRQLNADWGCKPAAGLAAA